MILRLTTPEALDRLIEYLEVKRDLVWPEWKGFDKTYRDAFIEIVKEKMQTDTVFIKLEWNYNVQTNSVEARAYYIGYSEIQTDEEYLEASKEEKNG